VFTAFSWHLDSLIRSNTISTSEVRISNLYEERSTKMVENSYEG
jgi:hypothetical protein